jgi:hypothetical protein
VFVTCAVDPTEPGALRPKGQLPRAHGRGIGVRVALVASLPTHSNAFSLGLFNAIEEQQVYSAIRDTVMHMLSYGAALCAPCLAHCGVTADRNGLSQAAYPHIPARCNRYFTKPDGSLWMCGWSSERNCWDDVGE